MNVVIDGGAWRGDTIEALIMMTGRPCTVLLFEPNPYLSVQIRENIEKIESRRANVECIYYQKALNDKNGEAPFYPHVEGTQGNSFYKRGKEGTYNYNAIIVETVDVAEIIEEYEYINILKLDIEGAEYKVLKRIFDQELEDKIGKFLVEWHAHKIDINDLAKEEVDNIRLKVEATGRYKRWV